MIAVLHKYSLIPNLSLKVLLEGTDEKTSYNLSVSEKD